MRIAHVARAHHIKRGAGEQIRPAGARQFRTLRQLALEAGAARGRRFEMAVCTNLSGAGLRILSASDAPETRFL
jgi:hypothetical protein